MERLFLNLNFNFNKRVENLRIPNVNDLTQIFDGIYINEKINYKI